MQSRHSVWRSACKDRNAYSPVLALRAAFGSSTRCLDEDDHLPSTSKPANTSPSIPNRNYSGGYRQVWQKDPMPLLPETLSKPPQGSQLDAVSRRKLRTIGHLTWKEEIAKIRAEAIRVDRDPPRDADAENVMRYLCYDAMVIRPQPSAMITPLPTPWATDERERMSQSVDQCLSMDIDRFAAWITPTAAEQRARTAVVQETLELIRSVLDPSEFGAELFGSEKNGIALPLSDIDIRVFDVKHPNKRHSSMLPRLETIRRRMRKGGKFIISTVRNSGYPILNCLHRNSGVDIQIVAGNDLTTQQEVVQKYIQQLPQLRPIYYVVRTTLSMRGLVDVYSGGMGSYGTFVMVLAIMNRYIASKKTASELDNNISPASLLIAFMEFYRDLDTIKHGVAVHPRALFVKHHNNRRHLAALSALAKKRGDVVRAGQWELCKSRLFQPYLLCLQDPASPTNDLARKCHAIKHIRSTFSHLDEVLRFDILELEKWKRSRTSELCALDPLLLPLVGRCHEVYYERRKKLEDYGKMLEAEQASGEAPPVEVDQVASC